MSPLFVNLHSFYLSQQLFAFTFRGQFDTTDSMYYQIFAFHEIQASWTECFEPRDFFYQQINSLDFFIYFIDQIINIIKVNMAIISHM